METFTLRTIEKALAKHQATIDFLKTQLEEVNA